MYYNYCAASAGTYCYASGSGTGNASYDVCPKGWRMPTGGPSGEYQALYTAYSSNLSSFRTAFSANLSGAVAGDTVIHQGVHGNFWSSTFSTTNNMYYYNVNASSALSNANPRGEGYSVRCIRSS